MHHDQYDDGLVHPHNFASSERGRMAEPVLTTQPIAFDDGLVHSHNFACSERGRPVHN